MSRRVTTFRKELSFEAEYAEAFELDFHDKTNSGSKSW
jgi:hypothetical protein